MNREQFHCSHTMAEQEECAVQEQTWENSISHDHPMTVMLKIVSTVIFLMI
jgi:hypothetical protein